jgi:hypothetical protein
MLDADHNGHAVRGMNCPRLLELCDLGFEPHSKNDCLCVRLFCVCVVLCVRLFCVCVVLCVVAALRLADHSSQKAY